MCIRDRHMWDMYLFKVFASCSSNTPIKVLPRSFYFLDSCHILLISSKCSHCFLVLVYTKNILFLNSILYDFTFTFIFTFTLLLLSLYYFTLVFNICFLVKYYEEQVQTQFKYCQRKNNNRLSC